MSNKHLQRVTECVSYIGHGVSRRGLPSHRTHIRQKLKIASQRTLYLSAHDSQPAEIFLRLKSSDYSSELIGLYDVIAGLTSVALQYGSPLEKVGDLLTGVKFEPCGLVSGHDRLKHCTSLPDLIGRHLLVESCDRHDLAHVPISTNAKEA